MILYIEYVILDNIVIDYMLLNILGKTFKDRFKKINIWFSVFVGTLSAICLPFIMNYKILLFIYKILTASVMVLVLKKYKTYRRYFLYLITLLTYTFMFGGIAMAVLNIFNITYTNNGLFLYNCEFPISSFIIIFWMGAWLLKKIVVALNQQMKVNNYLCTIKLSDKGKTIEGIGFFDSGNTIDRNGEYVNIISMEMFLKLHKDYSMEKLLFRNVDDTILKNPSYIEVKTISSTTKYLSFVIDKMTIDNNEYNNVVVAVATKNFENFDCIINSGLLGGSK